MTTNSSKELIDLPDDVRNCDYFHGSIPRIEAENSLRIDGEYLLRKAESSEGIYLVLSVKKDSFFHFPVSQDEKKLFYFETVKDSKITDLILNHLQNNIPISKSSNVLISKKVVRPVWLIKHEKLTLIKKLGAGAFGEVFLARMEDPTNEVQLQCAVKTMRHDASIDARLRFMKESRMMRKSYQHKHIVMIFGIAVHWSPFLIVMEVCPNGSLVSYLRKNKGNITIKEKMKFVVETASGLAYLEKINCIHRDVAARNCLLSATNEIKISDFGLANDKFLVIDYTLDKLPIKWLSPETMQEKIYSLKTDIWSFGVTVWEIFADGEEPYPGLTNVQSRAKIVVQDYRMKMPDGTPQEVIDVVETCWNKNPDKRGTMSAHHATLSAITIN